MFTENILGDDSRVQHLMRPHAGQFQLRSGSDRTQGAPACPAFQMAVSRSPSLLWEVRWQGTRAVVACGEAESEDYLLLLSGQTRGCRCSRLLREQV